MLIEDIVRVKFTLQYIAFVALFDRRQIPSNVFLFTSSRYDPGSRVGWLGPRQILFVVVRWVLWVLWILSSVQPRQDGGWCHVVVGAGVPSGVRSLLHCLHYCCLQELVQIVRSKVRGIVDIFTYLDALIR